MQPRPLSRSRPTTRPTTADAERAIAADLGLEPEQLRRLVAAARGRPLPPPAIVVLVRLGPGGDFTRDIIGEGGWQ
jgi:hypothetical protein